MKAKIRLFVVMDDGRERMVDVETIELPEKDETMSDEWNIEHRESFLSEKKRKMIKSRPVGGEVYKAYYYLESKMNDDRFFNSL